MQLGKASSLLANVFLLQRFFWNVVADCPYVNKVGPTIQEANELAVPRLAQYEEDFPAEDVGRTYNVGVENPNEVFCDGSEENKFCDKMHGEWGDSIPQTGEYCMWGILEFQDHPDFGYCTGNDSNTETFDGIFKSNLGYFLGLADASDHVMAIGYTAGSNCGGDSSPWPVASIIFKNGNSYAKPWIADMHRPSSQEVGYSLGWTFRGHFKAVKCEDISFSVEDPVMNGIVIMDDTTDFGGTDRDFQKFWNQFRSLTDLSPEFLSGPNDACVLDCPVGPCPPEETEEPKLTKSKKSTKGKKSKGKKGGEKTGKKKRF